MEIRKSIMIKGETLAEIFAKKDILKNSIKEAAPALLKAKRGKGSEQSKNDKRVSIFSQISELFKSNK